METSYLSQRLVSYLLACLWLKKKLASVGIIALLIMITKKLPGKYNCENLLGNSLFPSIYISYHSKIIFCQCYFLFSAILVIIALLVYTFHNWKSDVFFSWSYGGGWSTVALSIIAVVLIMADR